MIRKEKIEYNVDNKNRNGRKGAHESVLDHFNCLIENQEMQPSVRDGSLVNSLQGFGVEFDLWAILIQLGG
jgi:hypothetical protein